MLYVQITTHSGLWNLIHIAHDACDIARLSIFEPPRATVSAARFGLLVPWSSVMGGTELISREITVKKGRILPLVVLRPSKIVILSTRFEVYERVDFELASAFVETHCRCSIGVPQNPAYLELLAQQREQLSGYLSRPTGIPPGENRASSLPGEYPLVWRLRPHLSAGKVTRVTAPVARSLFNLSSFSRSWLKAVAGGKSVSAHEMCNRASTSEKRSAQDAKGGSRMKPLKDIRLA